MDITPEHMRASYDTYIRHGNSSSATVFSVMDQLRTKDMDELAPGGKVKDYVVGCAFGPGIAVEMCVMKRNMGHIRRVMVKGEDTPPETESEGSRSEGEGEGDALKEKLVGVQLQPAVSGPGDSLEEALNGVELD